jgi:hypothetical protein
MLCAVKRLLGTIGGAEKGHELTTAKIRLMVALPTIDTSPELVSILGDIVCGVWG